MGMLSPVHITLHCVSLGRRPDHAHGLHSCFRAPCWCGMRRRRRKSCEQEMSFQGEEEGLNLDQSLCLGSNIPHMTLTSFSHSVTPLFPLLSTAHGCTSTPDPVHRAWNITRRPFSTTQLPSFYTFNITSIFLIPYYLDVNELKLLLSSQMNHILWIRV